MIELRSPDGLARAIILPEYGGRLHQLFLTVDGSEEALLWSPDDPAEYAERPTRGGCFPMAPWPNRIANGRFTWEGREYHVPLVGRTHAIHGRVFDKPWNVTGHSPDSCAIRCPLDDGWPWRGEVQQFFELGNGAMSFDLSLRTVDRSPFGLGWHPWFRRNACGATDVRLRFPASERYVLRGNLPTGEVIPVSGEFDLRRGTALGSRRLDDCYRQIAGDLVIDWGRLRLQMRIQRGSGVIPHVQLYTPPEAFCVEPQTCAPDAFNLASEGVARTGTAVVDPGRPAAFSMVWRWAE